VAKPSFGGSKSPAATSSSKPEEKKSTPSESSDPSMPGAKFYTYDALKDPKNLPPDIDTNKKEMYLADDVFLKMFKMDKATFSKLPVWKKKRLKQKVNLY